MTLPPTDGTEPPDPGPEPISGDDLRWVEARLDSRLQEVFARLVLGDGRFDALTDRINQTERRVGTSADRFDARLGVTVGRLDRTDSRLDRLDAAIDDTRTAVTQAVREADHAITRTIIHRLAIGTVINAALCLATVLVTR